VPLLVTSISLSFYILLYQGQSKKEIMSAERRRERESADGVHTSTLVATVAYGFSNEHTGFFFLLQHHHASAATSTQAITTPANQVAMTSQENSATANRESAVSTAPETTKPATTATTPAAAVKTTVITQQPSPRPPSAFIVHPSDVFFTHDWRVDMQGRDNHARVARFNEVAKRLGLRTWFDAERMTGEVKAQMAAGIDATQVVVVFVTKQYCEKVAAGQDDNCSMEFNYAHLHKGVSRMIPVVMEPGMRDVRLWKGPLGLVLGGQIFYDCSDDDQLEKCVADVVGRVRSIVSGEGVRAAASSANTESGVAASAASMPKRGHPPATITEGGVLKLVGSVCNFPLKTPE
jgi:hypothetical protein